MYSAQLYTSKLFVMQQVYLWRGGKRESKLQCHCLLPFCALSCEPGGPDGTDSVCSTGSSTDRPEGQQPSAQCFPHPHSTFDLKRTTNSRNHWTRTFHLSSFPLFLSEIYISKDYSLQSQLTDYSWFYIYVHYTYIKIIPLIVHPIQ